MDIANDTLRNPSSNRVAAVVIQGVSKSFASGKPGGAGQALRGVDLTVGAGELLVLLGPSGSGKTTLLRTIAGLERPSSGAILMGGHDVTQVTPADRGVSMIFQEASLYPHMTVRENLGFGLKLRHIPREETDRRVQEAAALLGLATLLDRSPDALSGGERQRVALGRALVVEPEVLLLDEPFSQLDAPLRTQMRRDLVTLQRRLRTTMIYVTHDQLEAITMADRLAIMNAGIVEQAGLPLDLYQRPANVFVASFLGLPPINLFTGRIITNPGRLCFQTRDGLELSVPAGSDTFLAARAGVETLLGLRPEHVRLAHAATADASPDSFSVTVERVETVGWENHIWLARREQRLVARAPLETRPQVGDEALVSVATAHAHFFDQRSGQRLG